MKTFKRFISTVLLLALSLPLFSQVIIDEDITLHQKFKVGDSYYSSSYRGLKMLMSELQATDTEVYNQLLPIFTTLQQKEKTARTVLITSGAVSGTMIVGALTFWRKERVDESIFDPSSPLYSPPTVTKEPNTALLFTSAGVLAAGAIVYYIISPGESDYYNFVNKFNQFSPNKKMEWKVGLAANHNLIGLNFALAF